MAADVIERRRVHRFATVLPMQVAGRFYGSTINVSSAGACLELPLSTDIRRGIDSVHLRVTESDRVDVAVKVVWSKPMPSGKLALAVLFRHPDHVDETLLRSASQAELDARFVAETKRMRDMMQEIKGNCEDRDGEDATKDDQTGFIEKTKREVFGLMDAHYRAIWAIYDELPAESRRPHEKYYQLMLHDLVVEQVEINRHIYQKPLGHPGDFMVMNYIYTYHNGRYLGRSTFERLINHYTCSIPISKSNIGRKEFLKGTIFETITGKAEPTIMSVGAGPLRELFELLEEGRIKTPLSIAAVDFDPKAFDYVHSMLNKLPTDQRRLISVRNVQRNIAELIRNKTLFDDIGPCDLIYASGLFDYLTDRLAAALTSRLYGLLHDRGRLVILNASLQDSSHRAYYEFLGEWKMFHRTEADMLKWVRGLTIQNNRIGFQKRADCPGYLILVVEKS